MKNYWKYMIVALAGLSLFACNKEIEQPENNDVPSAEKFTYTIAVNGETKSHIDGDHMAWDDGDLIGWFINDGDPDCSEINYNADPRTFDVVSTTALPANSTVYAYAPFYTSFFSEYTLSKTSAPLSIPVHQDGLIYDAMPMVSLPIVIADATAANVDTPVAEAQFINLGAVIEYNVYTSDTAYGSEKVESVEFISDSNIAGDFPVDLTAVSESSIPSPSGLTRNNVISTLAAATTVGGSKDAGVKVYQVIAPGTWSGTIKVTTDAAVYEYPIANKEFSRSKIKTINANLASANATRTDKADYNTNLLTAHAWTLTTVLEEGSDATQCAGNKITLNSDNTISFDCASNQTYDYWVGGMVAAPNTSGMSWSLSENGGKSCLTVNNGYLLVNIFTDTNNVYEIKELTDSRLVVDYTAEYSWGPETWTLEFEAAVPPTVEELLTAHQWELTSYKVDWNYGAGLEDAVEGATVGNKIKFNADYSLEFDCSANSGYTHDYNFVGEDFIPYSVDAMSWSLADNNQKLVFPAGSFPLIILGVGEMSYNIDEITSSSLVISCVLWDTYPAEITFSMPIDPQVKAQLTAATWSVTKVEASWGTDPTLYDDTKGVGNKITFNSDGSLSFDCSANGGYWDYDEGDYVTPQNVDQMTWTLVGSSIVFSPGYPLFKWGGATPSSYGIEEIDSSHLVISANVSGWGAVYYITFSASSASPI